MCIQMQQESQQKAYKQMHCAAECHAHHVPGPVMPVATSNKIEIGLLRKCCEQVSLHTLRVDAWLAGVCANNQMMQTRSLLMYARGSEWHHTKRQALAQSVKSQRLADISHAYTTLLDYLLHTCMCQHTDRL